jgi:hypothetical protein
MGATAVSARRTPAGRGALRSTSGLRSRSMHDRVLTLQRMAGNRAVAQLARQPTAESDAPVLPRLTIPELRLPPPKPCVPDRTIQSAEVVKGDPESRKVKLDDGSLWLVKRERRITFSDRFIPQPPKLSFEHDADKVWAELDWCGGSHGNIQLGANPQEAGNAAIKAIEDTIRNGGSASDALDAASKTNVTPFLNFDIGQSRSWRVSGKVEVTLNREGHQGTKGTADVHVGPVHIKPNVTVDDKNNVGGGIDLVFGDSPPAVTCKHKQKLYARQETRYRWTPWIPEHEDAINVPYSYDFPTDYYLYFEYAKKTVNKKLSAAPRAALLAEMQRGGRVTSITAHTSPEGSHEAQGKWQGNSKLAEERAAAAEEWVRAVIAEAGKGSIDAKAKVESAEEAELYTLRDEQGKDVEGRDLEQHSEAMFGISDEEDRHRQEVDEELKRGPKSGRRRAEAVYKRLRRADIKVTRNESGVVPGTQKVPGKWQDFPASCPPVPDAEIAQQYPQYNL